MDDLIHLHVLFPLVLDSSGSRNFCVFALPLRRDRKRDKWWNLSILSGSGKGVIRKKEGTCVYNVNTDKTQIRQHVSGCWSLLVSVRTLTTCLRVLGQDYSVNKTA